MNIAKERKNLIAREIVIDRRKLDAFLLKENSLNGYIKKRIENFSISDAITDKYNKIKMTYEQLADKISYLASGMQLLGLSKSDFVCIFSENNGLCCVVEQASMRNGAISVLRGSNAPNGELNYILEHCEAKALIVKDVKLLNSLIPFLNNHNLKFIIVMFDNIEKNYDINSPVYSLNEVINLGKKHTFIEPKQNIDEPCLMLYTSGTTGNPKGVLITHKNILSQLPSFEYGFMSKQGENTLEILPVWHAYEHIAQIYYLTSGCHLHFSTLSGLKDDLVTYNIDTLMSVPRIWEAIRLGIFQNLKKKSIILYKFFDFAIKISIFYKIHKMYSERRITNKQNGYHILSGIYHRAARFFLKPIHILFSNTLYAQIKKAAGINFRASISGGGSLSMKDQLFYDAIGVNLREGYGLTETSPVITLRNVGDLNYLGSCGKPVFGTEIKILDIESKKELGIFQKGVVYVRGYQVTKGYYKNEDATKTVFTEDGWFNTGDIGWLTADNNLVLVGRLKETIVLSNGENIEPIPIEEACLESPYIDQIMLVGQDQASIGALVVPSEEALTKCGILAKDLKSGKNLTISNTTLRELIKKEIAAYIKNKKNLKSFEQIKLFEILQEKFSTSNGMISQTAKIKRNYIVEKYENLISNMFTQKAK